MKDYKYGCSCGNGGYDDDEEYNCEPKCGYETKFGEGCLCRKCMKSSYGECLCRHCRIRRKCKCMHYRREC
ncbi:MAG: hypothetical protein PHQ46_00840 [Negativicutes bacterium]|nr:hypothetical protein [Negativicutes bacterium]